MAEEQMSDDVIPTFGYSKDEPKLFYLKPGKKLPKGYYMNPAMVPGSEAEKHYREDAEREHAPIPWETPAPTAPAAPVPDPAPQAAPDPAPAPDPSPAPVADAPADKAADVPTK